MRTNQIKKLSSEGIKKVAFAKRVLREFNVPQRIGPVTKTWITKGGERLEVTTASGHVYRYSKVIPMPKPSECRGYAEYTSRINEARQSRLSNIMLQAGCVTWD